LKTRALLLLLTRLDEEQCVRLGYALGLSDLRRTVRGSEEKATEMIYQIKNWKRERGDIII
jgi:hypothetical protein